MGESLAWGLRQTRAAAAETLATARAGPGSDAARQLPLRLPTHTTTVEVDDVVRAFLLVRAQGKAVLGPVLMEPLRGAPEAHEERAPVLKVLWLCVLQALPQYTPPACNGIEVRAVIMHTAPRDATHTHTASPASCACGFRPSTRSEINFVQGVAVDRATPCPHWRAPCPRCNIAMWRGGGTKARTEGGLARGGQPM